MPTCPLNPKVKDVLENPIEINSKQGYYTNFVNLADLAGLAIPNTFRADGLPVGVTLLYAENAAKDFRPSPGQITELSFPSWARVDGWAEKGTIISTEYDPTVAKIIVHGRNREETLRKLRKALEETNVGGIITNKDYLLAVSQSDMFKSIKMHTKVLDSFSFKPPVFEVLVPGSNTSIQ
ncbi:hypothetical protein FF38_08096, partial [Lucilia cuprina]